MVVLFTHPRSVSFTPSGKSGADYAMESPLVDADAERSLPVIIISNRFMRDIWKKDKVWLAGWPITLYS